MLEPAQEPRADALPSSGRAAGIHWARLDVVFRREILVVLGLLLCYGFFQQVPLWNENSRYDLVRALVEDGTTQIDRFQDNTGDKAFYLGHYYSDKPPGTAFLGVPLYILLNVASNAAGLGTPDPTAAVEALAFVESGVPTALLVVLLMRFLRLAVGDGWAIVVSLAYGLGSLAFPFATMYFGHAATVFLLFASFYALWRAKTIGNRQRWPALAGFLAGWAVLVDVSALLGVFVLLLYALFAAPAAVRGRGRVDVRKPAAVVLGAIIPAALFLAYNWVSFGGPFSLGYANLANAGFAEGIRRGLLGVSWPSLGTLWELLFGTRGLVRLAPWFLLAPLGILAVRRRDVRDEVLVCAAITGLFLAANAGYFLPFGGATPGPRFLLPALPFAAILVALAPAVFRPLTVFLMAIGVVLVFVATVTIPNAGEGFRDPLFELWLPRLASAEIAQTIPWLRWGLGGFQPLAVLALGLCAAASALVASFRSGAPVVRWTGVIAAALAVALVAFAFPLWPPTTLALNELGGSPTGAISTRDVGAATAGKSSDVSNARIWAQLENDGPALDDTRVVFSVLAPDGKTTWSAWHPSVAWRQGERKRLAVEWDTRNAPAGDYGVVVSVVANAGGTVHGSAAFPAEVHVGVQSITDVFRSGWVPLMIGTISVALLVGSGWRRRSALLKIPVRIRAAYRAFDERWPVRDLVPDAGTVLLIVLAVSLLLRAAWLNLPQGALIFDESYYVNAARVILGLHLTPGAHYADAAPFLDPNTEHPPLGKLFMAGSIALFGDNGIGWRVPSVIAGMVALAALYGVVRAAGGRPWLGVLAVALYSLDVLSFIHGRIGTLDMMSVAFLLVGAWLGLRGQWVLAGAALALGTLIKVPGVYGLLAALLWQGLGLWRAYRQRPLTWNDFAPTRALVGAYAFVGLGGLWLLDLRFTTYSNPLDHINHMLSYGFALQGAFNPTGGITSAPWQWLVNEGQFDYLKTAVNTIANGNVIGSKTTIQFRALLNPALLGAAPLAVLFAVWLAWKRGEALLTWALLWIAANYLPYWELALLSNRITYFYYVLPTVPGLAVIVSAFLIHGRLPRAVVWGFLGVTILAFIANFPFREVP